MSQQIIDIIPSSIDRGSMHFLGNSYDYNTIANYIGSSAQALIILFSVFFMFISAVFCSLSFVSESELDGANMKFLKNIFIRISLVVIIVISTVIIQFQISADDFVKDNTPTLSEKVSAQQQSIHDALEKVQWDDSEDCINSTSGYGSIVPCNEVIPSTANSKHVITTMADNKHYDVMIKNQKVFVSEIDNFVPIQENQNQIPLIFHD